MFKNQYLYQNTNTWYAGWVGQTEEQKLFDFHGILAHRGIF